MRTKVLLPEGWEENYLDKVTQRGSGHTPNQKHPDYWNGGIKWVSLADSSHLDRRSIDHTEKEISEEGLKNSSAVLHPKGTVLLSRDAGVGKSSIMGCDMAVSQHFITWNCRAKHTLDNLFLYYWLQGKKGYFERQAVGSTIKTIGLPLFKKLKISYPPLPEQKAIADLLTTWDEAIEKTERLIQAKEMRFKWLLRELISEPRNTQKDAKWKRVKIGSFLTESRIPGTNGRDAQKITVKLYGKGVIAKDEKRIGSETTHYYVRKSGQFIYSKLDFLNGAFGIIPEELDGFESTLDLPTFDISDSVSKKWFLYYLIRPEYYTRQLGLAKGQRKARRVNPSEFLKSKIPFPPLEVQKKIAETLSSAQHEIDLLKQLAEKYKTQKRGLMQKMLTGEWRVKPEIVNQYMEA